MSKPLPSHLFTSCEGELYDTRVLDWHRKTPLRSNYSRTHSRIQTVADLKATLRNGGFAWPGGYPLYFITADGSALSFETVRKEFRQIAEAIKTTDSRGGWKVEACEVNYEDSELLCDHSGERIPSAYGDDSEAETKSLEAAN